MSLQKQFKKNLQLLEVLEKNLNETSSGPMNTILKTKFTNCGTWKIFENINQKILGKTVLEMHRSFEKIKNKNRLRTKILMKIHSYWRFLEEKKNYGTSTDPKKKYS